MQLDLVPVHAWQPVGEQRLEHDVVATLLLSRQRQHLADRLVDVDQLDRVAALVSSARGPAR